MAGDDRVVLVVGPAGTGKTTALRRAAEDLARQHRPVFGLAPTAKAAKVLHDETGLPADTVAKRVSPTCSPVRNGGASQRLPPFPADLQVNGISVPASAGKGGHWPLPQYSQQALVGR